MTTRLIIPPAELAVSLDDARRAARVDIGTDGTSPLDAEITQAIQTYTGQAEHLTNRVFITQTWRETLDGFPAGVLELSKARLQGVDSVKYFDAAGVQQTLAPAMYQVDTDSEPGLVLLAPGAAWPATPRRFDAVQVQYKCGYGDDDTAVPAVIKGYILACIQQQFAPVGTSKVDEYARLLDPETVY